MIARVLLSGLLATLAAIVIVPPRPAAGQAAPSGAVEVPAPVTPAPAPPIPSPFGPGYDPTRPPPEDPKDAGAGIAAATLIASGPAAIEEMPVADPSSSPFFGVAVDIEVAAASTTPVLSPATVAARLDGAPDLPLVAACTPTMDDPDGVWHGEGATVAAWNVSIGGSTWFCGGRTARLAVRVGPGGLRLRTPKGASWKGTLVLLFSRLGGEVPTRLLLPGVQVELPAAGKVDAAL